MQWWTWIVQWLPVAGLAITALGALDPLEGFPVVLIGGVLTVMAALQERSRFARLAIAGLVSAAVGCAVLVGLSAVGGVGEGTPRSLWWLALVAPYPIGAITFATAAVLLLRERRGRGRVERA